MRLFASNMSINFCLNGDQITDAYSRMGRQTDLKAVDRVFVFAFLSYCISMCRVLVAFLQVTFTCGSKLNLLSMVIPST